MKGYVTIINDNRMIVADSRVGFSVRFNKLIGLGLIEFV